MKYIILFEITSSFCRNEKIKSHTHNGYFFRKFDLDKEFYHVLFLVGGGGSVIGISQWGQHGMSRTWLVAEKENKMDSKSFSGICCLICRSHILIWLVGWGEVVKWRRLHCVFLLLKIFRSALPNRILLSERTGMKVAGGYHDDTNTLRFLDEWIRQNASTVI